MNKKVNWLDAFAESQAKKLEKKASSNDLQRFIVSAEDIESQEEGIKDGCQVSYNGGKYTVIKANFKDEIGEGVVLEKLADDESVVPSGSEQAMVEQAPVAEPMVENAPIQNEQGGENVMAKKDMRSQYLKKVAEELLKKDEEMKEEDVVEEQPEDVKEEDLKELDVDTDEPLQEEVVEPVAPMEPVNPMVAPVEKGQQYARQPYQGPIYDTNVRDVEQAKFEGEATETANKINSDNAVDRTTVQGRYSNNSILNSIVNSVLDPMAMEMGTEVAPTDAPVVPEKIAKKK